jgi:hypothetical protein
MDPRTNPYSPGAGLRPIVLSGRDNDIEAFQVLLERAKRGLNSRSIVFTGLRGVGKTVLLVELAGQAAEQGWLVAQVEAEHTGAPGQFAANLASGLMLAVRRRRSWLDRAKDSVREAVTTLASFNMTVNPDGGITFGAAVNPAHGRADSGVIQSDLVDLAEALGEAARDDGIGVVVFIDEMQALDATQMSAICRSCHRAGQRGLPWFVIGGGLPNLAAKLADAESYAERLFDYRIVDRLAHADAVLALRGAADPQGVSWANDAVEFVERESGGYPYFLQQFGKSTWDVASDIAITLDDALLGVAEGHRALDAGFFNARWERATPFERDFLRAMAIDDGRPSRTGEVAERLGKATTSLGPARAQLIAKGIIYSPEHGTLAYTVPGMADYVRRRDHV